MPTRPNRMLWKLILHKNQEKCFFLEETERGECADAGSVKDVAVHRCCCCWDQDLCHCCYCQLESLSMKGGLLRESCVSVCAPADVSVDLRVYIVHVFVSGCACEVAELISECFSCRHRMLAGGPTCCNPSTLLSPLTLLLLPLLVSLCSFPSCLSLHFLFYLSASVSLSPPPPPLNKVPFWEE